MNNRTLVPYLLMALCVTAPALAKFEAPDARTTYQLRGEDSKRGAFTSTIAIDPATGIGLIEVVRVVRYAEEPNATSIQRGMGKVEEGVLRVTLTESHGAARHIDNSPLAPPTELFLRLEEGKLDADGQSAAGDSKASSGLPAAADEGDSDESTIGKFKQKGKHLLAVAEDKIKDKIRQEREKLIYDGVKLDKEFGFGRFFHVGIGGAVRALRDSHLSPGQAYTSRSLPNHVWLVNNVHGGVRTPLSTSIPVGQVSVGVGLNVAARVDYEVTDIYPIPEGVSRDGLEAALADLRSMAKRSFDLPLDASEAGRMNIGARRVFDGQGSVAISGSLGIGHDVVDYGSRSDGGLTASDVSKTIKIGASAHVGGFYRIQGDIRIIVERLIGDRVRVRVRRGDTTSRGVSANLFVGAAVNETELKDELEPVTEYIDEGLVEISSLPDGVRERVVEASADALTGVVADKVREVLRFRLNADASESVRDEIDISHLYDLGNPTAREAYEKAVRGDFTHSAALTLEPDSGVIQEFRVLEVEEHTHLGLNIDLSILLEASATRDIRVSTINVEDENGARNYEVFRLDRNRRLRFLRDRHKRMSLEVIRREVPDAPEGERVQSSLRLTLDILDPHTFSWQGNPIKRLLTSWGLDGEGTIPMGKRRFGHSRYGETRFQLRAEISDRGLRTALATSDAGLLDAYVRAFTTLEDEVPMWATPEGRRELDFYHDNDDNRKQFAKAELSSARDFVKSVGALRTANDAEGRAKALKRLGKSSKFDHYVLAAFVNLVPRDAVSLDASFMGDRVRIVDGRRSGEALVSVNDPRR